ncbi:MAG: hypothetical protein HY399_00490 [Elusimicrobia bacterium]|nr:hypothetical protein [Elusimicrobiota bacterium]
MSPRNFSLGIVAVLLVLGSTKEAWMSQVFYQKISLEDVMDWSRVVVIAKLKKTETEKIKISSSDLETKKKAPPFLKRIFYFERVEVLYSRPEVALGKILAVLSANYEGELESHRRYYLENISESPIYFAYKPSESAERALEKKQPVLLFLRNEGQTFQFIVEDSYESLDKKDQILKMIEKKKAKDIEEPSAEPESAQPGEVSPFEDDQKKVK